MVIEHCRKFISKHSISTPEKKVNLKLYIKSKSHQQDKSKFAKKKKMNSFNSTNRINSKSRNKIVSLKEVQRTKHNTVATSKKLLLRKQALFISQYPAGIYKQTILWPVKHLR